MSELIERQAAIEVIDKALSRTFAEPCGEMILKDAPSAQPEPQWIPVSERLPEDTQYVLLTVRRLNNAYNSTPFISVGYIGWNQRHWWCAHDGDCEIGKVEVLAWMPLPEAYKPNK